MIAAIANYLIVIWILIYILLLYYPKEKHVSVTRYEKVAAEEGGDAGEEVS